MRLATFSTKAGTRPTMGAYINEHYVDLHGLSKGALPDTMLGFLQLGDTGFAQARALLRDAGSIAPGQAHVYAPDGIVLCAPVPRPGKIIHTSCNFDSHLEELTTWEDPQWQSHNWADFHFEHPTGFLEAPSSVSASGASVAIPHFTKQLDHEVEIAIIIGKKAFRVAQEDAFDHVAGYTVFNDLSARDIQTGVFIHHAADQFPNFAVHLDRQHLRWRAYIHENTAAIRGTSAAPWPATFNRGDINPRLGAAELVTGHVTGNPIIKCVKHQRGIADSIAGMFGPGRVNQDAR